MAVPALRIPLGLDTQTFDKSISEAKSLTSSATDFIVKEFVKMQARAQIKLAIQSDQFKPAVQGAAKFLGDQFAAVKPQIQAFTQSAVKETTEAGLKVASVFASPAIKGSFQAFTAVGVPAATGLAQALLPIALRALAVGEALHLVAEAVGAAREQISQMVAIADKASNLQVTPQFLQQFEGEARKLKVTTDDLDTFLTHAFDATKEKSPIDVSKWEAAGERITDVELALRVYNVEVQKATGKPLQGLVDFRDAQTQGDKIKAVLQAMVQLDQLGQHLQSLDVGDKFFGPQFVDRVRQGKISAEGILDTMDKLKASQDGIFPDDLVNRAKAVDDQLKLSQDRLSRALKPEWDGIASVILTIKGYWADVVDLMARALEIANKLPNVLQSGAGKGATEVVKQNALGVAGALPVVGPFITAARAASSLFAPDAPPTPENRLRVDAPPSRGAGPAPKLKSDGGRDPLDVAIDQTEKRIATLKAETETIDLNTAAQDRAKTVAQLEEAAKRANTEAGKKNTEVTDEQRKKIEQEADAVQKAADAYARKQVASQIKFDRGTAFLTQDDVAIAQQLKGIYGSDIPAALNSSEAAAIRFNSVSKEIANTISTNLTTSLADVIDGTKTAGQAFQAFSKIVIRAIEEAIIKLLIVGPLMRSLQGGFSILGVDVPSIGHNAGGTDNWGGGLTWVGEKGPELLNLPRGSQVIPNVASRNLASGGSSAIVYNIDAAGADAGTVQRIFSVLRQHSQAIGATSKAIGSAQYSQSTGVSRG